MHCNQQWLQRSRRCLLRPIQFIQPICWRETLWYRTQSPRCRSGWWWCHWWHSFLQWILSSSIWKSWRTSILLWWWCRWYHRPSWTKTTLRRQQIHLDTNPWTSGRERGPINEIRWTSHDLTHGILLNTIQRTWIYQNLWCWNRWLWRNQIYWMWRRTSWSKHDWNYSCQWLWPRRSRRSLSWTLCPWIYERSIHHWRKRWWNQTWSSFTLILFRLPRPWSWPRPRTLNPPKFSLTLK